MRPARGHHRSESDRVETVIHLHGASVIKHVSMTSHADLVLPGAGSWERLARVAFALSGTTFVVSLAMVVGGSLHQPDSGPFAALLSDGFVLIWMTLASTAHLVLVPSICALVAFRDHRRAQAGIPVPPPRSVWKGHASVFGS